MKQQKYIIYIILAAGLLCTLFYATGSNGEKQKRSYEKAVVISAELVESPDSYARRNGQELTVRIITGPESGKTVTIFNNLAAQQLDFDRFAFPGDRVFVAVSEEAGIRSYYFSDFDRMLHFQILLVVFVLGLLYFGRTVGLRSLIAMVISLAMLWYGFMAFILEPTVNIYFLSVTFCVIISCIILLIVSGVSVKTAAALLGTLGGLALASLLSYYSIKIMHLTGIETEEAYMLKAHLMPYLDFRGIYFASIILGSIGAIIDVTISIAAAQLEIYRSSPQITWRQLYSSGMAVGKDVMGAMSNTLILAYVGSSLPLLLTLAADNALPSERIINLPFVMSELVRAIIGSIGLTYAIPFTSLIMSALVFYKRSD